MRNTEWLLLSNSIVLSPFIIFTTDYILPYFGRLINDYHGKEKRQFISRLRSHQHEQGSLDEGDFLPHGLKMEEMLEKIIKKLGKLDTLEKRLDKLDAVEKKLDGVEKKLDAVEKDVRETKRDIKALRSDILRIDNRLSDQEERISGIT